MQTILHITGFGKFCGVEDNPSKRIIEIIQKDPSVLPKNKNYKIVTCDILEVSAKAVKDYFQKMKDFKYDSNAKIIFLHFGVDCSARNYHLEVRAANHADFRAPDEQQYQPKDEKIIHEIEEDFLYTSLPVQQIAQKINKLLENEHQKIETVIVKETNTTKDPNTCLESIEKISTKLEKEEKKKLDICELSEDAGRFVCNYIYFHSLHHTIPRKMHSLFVHIPSHETIAIEEQIKFVKVLLQTLVE